MSDLDRSKTKIAIIGAGGHAKVALAAAEAAGYSVVRVFDDVPAKRNSSILSYKVDVPIPMDQYWREQRLSGHIAIGDNKVRESLADSLRIEYRSIIHPSAQVHRSAVIGYGTLICAGAIIQPDVTIGMHCIVNTGAIVEHDCHVADFSHLGPRVCIAGNVKVERGCFLGVGSAVIPGKTIGAGALIGAGAVVVDDVVPGSRVAGVPARMI